MDPLIIISWLIMLVLQIVRMLKYDTLKSAAIGAGGAMENLSLPQVSGEYLERLKNRKIGDFKMPLAAFPAPENDILPQEGFVLIDLSKEGKPMWRIIAAVSAEKTWDIFTACVALLGETIGVVIRDYIDDAKAREFDAPSMYNSDVQLLLDHYRHWIVDNGAMDVGFFSVDKRIEFVLDRWKMLHFTVEDPVVITDVLMDFGIPGKREMNFYQEKRTIFFMYPGYQQELQEVLAGLNVEHSEEIK